MKKFIISGIILLATLCIFRFDIVENGKGYYIENGSKALLYSKFDFRKRL